VTLDEVDGAFYWLGCRHGDYPSWLPGGTKDQTDEQLRSLTGELPDWPLWLGNDLPKFRSAWARVLHEGHQAHEYHRTPGKIVVGVPNASWRGAEFAAFAKQWDRDLQAMAPDKWEKLHPVYGGVREVNRLVNVMVGFEEAGSLSMPVPMSLQMENSWGVTTTVPLVFPCVMVEIAYPLPLTHVLAAIYDAYVIEEHQLHDRLKGETNAQTTLVAIRAWLVSLLVKGGMRHRFAMEEAERIGLRWVEQPRHSVDRHMVLRRVPEAEPYL